MSWHYSRVLVEGFSAANCSAGARSVLLNVTPTPQAFLSPDRMTAFSRLFRFGMTSAPLTESLGADVLTWFLAGFPVRTFQPPVKAQGSPENAADSGVSLLGSLATFDPVSCLWRTPQCSLFEDSASSLQIWPRWGSMRDGVCWELETPARGIHENASGFLPTPTATDYKGGRNSSTRKDGTSTLSEFRHWLRVVHGLRYPILEHSETVMGWPEKWTRLNVLETDKFQQWLRWHGEHLVPALSEQSA